MSGSGNGGEERYSAARRNFLRGLGGAVACAGAAAMSAKVLTPDAKAESAPSATPPSPPANYDWTKHRWAFGVDATKCIGCLRCVEACKTENDVPQDAHHFRTWVERYVYLEGEEKARIDSQQDPVNIAASGSERRLPLRQSLQGREGREGVLRAQAVQPLHPSGLRAGMPHRRHLQDRGRRGPHRPQVLHRLPVLRAGLPLRRALLQRARRASPTSAPGAITASPRACSRPASRSVRSARASSATCNDKQSPISLFVRNNRVAGAEARDGQRAQRLLRRPRQGGAADGTARRRRTVHRLRLPERDGHPVDGADRRLSRTSPGWWRAPSPFPACTRSSACSASSPWRTSRC